MDSPTYKNDENRWIEERIANLKPPAGFEPDTDRALERLVARRQPGFGSRRVQLLMAAAVVGAAGFVIALLPWQVLLKPEAGVNVSAVQAQQSKEPATTPAGIPALPIVTRSPAQSSPSQTLHAAEQQGNPPSPQSGATEPIVISQVQPKYTQEAKDNRITGIVELLCVVRTDGTVEVKSIQKGLGYGLDESAWDAVEQWRFEPGRSDGVPVATEITILVNFGLK
jgi:TonB family protein